MDGTLLFFIVCLILVVGFILFHLNPLTNDEVVQLATKRRARLLSELFSFSRHEVGVSKSFKKSMDPDGRLYQVNEELAQFPCLAAALLKYKKHEWVIIAFEANRVVGAMWVNKGFDRHQVAAHLTLGTVLRVAKQQGFKSILVLHNHPNTDPAIYDCRQPSPQDVNSATEWGRVLSQHGVNLMEFVCERGRHFEYHRTISDEFMPTSSFVSEIEAGNGLSWWTNLSLHLERIL